MLTGILHLTLFLSLVIRSSLSFSPAPAAAGKKNKNNFVSSSSFPLEKGMHQPRSSTVLFGVVDDSDDDETKPKKEIISEINLSDDNEYTSNIDWDMEWKKVVQNQGKQVDRPGKDFYKSDAEIAAIRAAKKARERAVKIASKVPSVPSFDTLKGDWKFWVAILAVISIGTSLLSGMSMSSVPSTASPDSYYI